MPFSSFPGSERLAQTAKLVAQRLGLVPMVVIAGCVAAAVFLAATITVPELVQRVARGAQVLSERAMALAAPLGDDDEGDDRQSREGNEAPASDAGASEADGATEDETVVLSALETRGTRSEAGPAVIGSTSRPGGRGSGDGRGDEDGRGGHGGLPPGVKPDDDDEEEDPDDDPDDGEGASAVTPDSRGAVGEQNNPGSADADTPSGGHTQKSAKQPEPTGGTHASHQSARSEPEPAEQQATGGSKHEKGSKGSKHENEDPPPQPAPAAEEEEDDDSHGGSKGKSHGGSHGSKSGGSH